MGNLIWTDAALEPKRKFKYLLNIGNPIFSGFEFLAQTCDRPGIKVGASEHKYFDKTYYHPGRVTWDPNPISVKLVDIQRKTPSETDTNGALLKAFAASGLSGLVNTDGSVTTLSKQKATDALKSVKIRVLNADRGVAEVWELKNAWLESFKPDALDYGAEDILTVTMTIRYDWAEFRDATEEEAKNKFAPQATPVGSRPPQP